MSKYTMMQRVQFLVFIAIFIAAGAYLLSLAYTGYQTNGTYNQLLLVGIPMILLGLLGLKEIWN